MTKHVLTRWYNIKLKLITQGILVGLVTGIIVVAYRLVLQEEAILRLKVYDWLRNNNIFYIGIWFLILAIFGIILGKIIQKHPMIKGSGIPQVKGFLLRQLKFSWLKELIAKFFGGIISIGLGMSLGREGPSVQLGACIGVGVNKLLNKFNLEEKYLVTAGASAGLSAAFNAPLAGVIFALEELHKSFSPLILACAMTASVVASFISSTFFGLAPVFNFKDVPVLPTKFYLYVIILGIIAAFLGKLFNKVLIMSQSMMQKFKIKNIYKPIIPLALSIIIGLFIPSVLGGGHSLIEELSVKKLLLSSMIIIFIIKLLFTAVCYGSGVPGGIFLPILVLGALLGKGYTEIISPFFNISDQYVINFMVLAMAAYLTSVVRAPVTASVLITEMTGSFDHLMALITICLTCYVVTSIINSKGIYDVLLKNMLKDKKSSWLKDCGEEKIVMEIPVSYGSQLDHKMIKEIKWPQGCLMVGIKRADKELIPKGDTVIHPGDYLIVLTDEINAPVSKLELVSMGSENIETIQT